MCGGSWTPNSTPPMAESVGTTAGRRTLRYTCTTSKLSIDVVQLLDWSSKKSPTRCARSEPGTRAPKLRTTAWKVRRTVDPASLAVHVREADAASQVAPRRSTDRAHVLLDGAGDLVGVEAPHRCVGQEPRILRIGDESELDQHRRASDRFQHRQRALLEAAGLAP